VRAVRAGASVPGDSSASSVSDIDSAASVPHLRAAASVHDPHSGRHRVGRD
jgi:hypothetical protein